MAAEELTQHSYPAIAGAMESDAPNWDTRFQSFASQIHSIHKEYDPDLYLFTAFSAIPLADSVRGYYEGKNQQVPQLGFIRADTRTSREFRGKSRQRLVKEVTRLTPIVEKISSVCVVDQYTSTGSTLKFARTILEACNVPEISSIEGRWYQQAYRRDLNLRDMTSDHRQFMYAIGSRASEQPVA